MSSTVGKIVIRDVVDEATGIRFVEDIRGNLHLAPSFNSNIVVSAPDVVASPPIVNIESGTNYAECAVVFLQTALSNYTWFSATGYNKVPNSYNTNIPLTYTVPTGHLLHILELVVVQDSKGESREKTSYLGLFKNNLLLAGFPLKESLTHTFGAPIVLQTGSVLDIRFKPHTVKTDLGVIITGYLV